MNNFQKLLSVFVVVMFIIAGVFFAYKNNKTNTPVSLGNYLSLSIPKNWNYKISSDNNNLVVSDYKGELSFQDRSSEKETARLTITTTNSSTVSAGEYQKEIQNALGGQVNTSLLAIDGVSATRLDDPGRNVFYIILAKDTKLVTVFGATYANKNDNLQTLNDIIASIRFTP